MSQARRRVIKKAAQLGFTEIEVLRTLHGQIHGKYPKGVLYLFPTQADVSDFSKARFDPLIADNYHAIGRFVNSTDAVNIKKIGSGVLYLRGARATKSVGGVKSESSRLKSIPVDKVVFDERDSMDDKMVAMALERMGHSDVKEESSLSTPTIPDYGVDKEYELSSKGHWLIKCRKCNAYTCLETEFPNCIVIDEAGKGHRLCKKCRQEIYPCDGVWVDEHPDNPFEGYWISQLNSAYVDPADILRAYCDPPNGNLGEIKNSKLGMAHIEAENRLSRAQVYHCCGSEPIAMTHRGPCAMGVDIGKVLHVVIGYRKNTEQFCIVKMCTVPDWAALHDLALRFNVRCEVQDMYPETHKGREYQKAEKHQVMLCQYSDSLATSAKYDHKSGIVTVNRTEICDATHGMVATESKLELPRRCDEVDLFCEQLCNISKVAIKDEESGLMVYRYIKTGDDHYRHALNYFKLAANQIDIVAGEFTPRKQTTSENEWNPLA
jgi:hypothetical protein